MTAKILRFPNSHEDRINQIIDKGRAISAVKNQMYISPEDRLRQTYELEEFLGMPFGSLREYKENEDGER